MQSVALCLLHAYAEPRHERALMRLAAEEAPNLALSASHVVSPEFRGFEHTMTTLGNAFVGPVVGRYAARLVRELAAGGHAGALQLMQWNGGVMPAAQAGSNAARQQLDLSRVGPDHAPLMNDPCSGGQHRNDLIVFQPVFLGAKLLFWAGNAAHHLDFGRGDIDALFAANHVGARRLRELDEREGVATIRAEMRAALDHAERLVRAAIAAFPDGTGPARRWWTATCSRTARSASAAPSAWPGRW